MSDVLVDFTPLSLPALMAHNGDNRATGNSARTTLSSLPNTSRDSTDDIPAAWRIPQQTSITTTAASTTNATQPSPNTDNAPNMRDRITLVQPRPDGQRITNYYTETPFRPAKLSPKPKGDNNASPAGVHSAGIRSSGSGGDPVSRIGRPITTVPLPTSRFNNVVNTRRTITTQPCTFSKEKPDVSPTGGDSDCTDDGRHGESIICHDCGRCKCEACRNPRPLPSTWICNDKCECSAESCVDLCTCMCCVKAAFYHCTDYDTSDDSCADKPCSCNPHRRCLRWGCMGVLGVILPCLLCYWPMKGCTNLCESCYANYTTSHGCRCSNPRRKLPNTAKRLLDPASDC